MAHLFKKTLIRHVDSTGKRCPKDAADAKQKKEKSSKWYGRYRQADGTRKEVALYTDKTASRQRLAALEKQAEHEATGLRSPFADHVEQPLANHLADYVAVLQSRGLSAVYVANTERYCRELLTGCKFKRWPDVSASAVQKWLGSQRTQKRGLVVLNHLLASGKQFFAWMVQDRRCPENPLLSLQRFNADVETRRQRRALSEVEIASLLTVTESSNTVRNGLDGMARSMLYRSALYLGLRASELASLNESSFDFTEGTVTLLAAFSKHRREDELPVHADLAERLQAWFQSRRSSQTFISLNPESEVKLWPGDWAAKRAGASMLRADLKAAGIEFKTSAGQVDFHALRTSFVTRLSRSGVSLVEAQRLARHADPKITAKNYTKLELHDLSAAVGRLPLAVSTQKRPAATGTDGAIVERPDLVALPVALAPDAACDSVTTGENSAPCVVVPTMATLEMQKPLKIRGSESDCLPLKAPENECPRQDLNLHECYLTRPSKEHETTLKQPKNLRFRHNTAISRRSQSVAFCREK